MRSLCAKKYIGFLLGGFVTSWHISNRYTDVTVLAGMTCHSQPVAVCYKPQD